MSGSLNARRGEEKPTRSGISNNTLALIALVFMAISISCSIIVYMGTEPEQPLVGFSTSQDSAYVTIRIIGLPPTVTIHTPSSCDVVSGNVLLNASVGSNDNSTVINVSFYYGNDSGEWIYIGSDYYDGDSLYNMSWNTTGLMDSADYVIRAEATDISHRSGEAESGAFTVNNVDLEPDWSEFKYSVSTNLSLLSSWDSVPDLRLGNPFGFMNFSGRSVNLDGQNLSRYFNVSNKKFMMDGAEMRCMDGLVYLHFVNVSMVAPNTYRNGVPCSSGICALISNNMRDVVVRVTNFATYQLVNNANYDIWDITDANRTPGNEIRYRGQQVEFFLNLSANGITLNNSDIGCFIDFNETGVSAGRMTLRNRSLYEYNRSFDSPGVHFWDVRCNSTDDGFFSIYDSDNVTISNRAPRLIKDLPNITMEEDTVALYVNDLNDYFEDREGDEITFSVSYIPDVSTTVAHDSIVIRPARDWFGNRTFVVYATDEFGLQNLSNPIHLTVIDMPEPPTPPSSGGGGYSGDETELSKENPNCKDEWICSAWSECMFRWTWNVTGLNASFESLTRADENDGIMTRSCYDKNRCNYWWKRPNVTDWCYYTPKCNDNIKNGNETGVDCGGLCASCFTCGDGIQNQNETGVDCGGPCAPCSTCTDGKMNCHDGSCEAGVDCGGPCANVCPEIEKPAVKINLMTVLLVGLLMLSLLFTFYLFVRPYLVRIYIWLMGKRKKEEQAPEATLLEIETRYLALLEKLKVRAAKADIASVSGELNSIFRKFLLEAFKISTEDTLEDLGEMIRKSKLPGMLRIALTTYIREIVKIGYSSAKTSRAEVISNIDKAKELLDLIVRNMPGEEETEGKGKAAGKPDALAKKKGRISRDDAGLPAAYRLAIEAKRDLVKGDVKAAIAARKEMGNLYKWLKKNEREELRRRLAELDREISNAKKGDMD